MSQLQQVDKYVNDIVSANHVVYSQEVPLQVARSIKGIRTVDEVGLIVRLIVRISLCLSVCLILLRTVNRCIRTQSGWSVWRQQSLTCCRVGQADRRLRSSAVEREAETVPIMQMFPQTVSLTGFGAALVPGQTTNDAHICIIK